jgi:hypothetical protein
MIWKTNEANFGLNDIPGLCVNYTYLIAQSIFFCQSICVPANGRCSAFKLYYKEVKIYCILNLII